MPEADPLVCVVDDNASVRTALKRFLSSVGMQCETYPSAQEFLQRNRLDVPTCLVLDVRLPGLSGLELQRHLAQANHQIPIIFITGYGEVPTAIRAMKAGAVEFLTKPFHKQDLLDAVLQALQRDRTARQNRAYLATLRERWESLTPRENEVLRLVVAGRLNKQIAAELGTSEKTIKVHRHQVMRKMQAQSLAQLVLMGEKLSLAPPKV